MKKIILVSALFHASCLPAWSQWIPVFTGPFVGYSFTATGEDTCYRAVDYASILRSFDNCATWDTVVTPFWGSWFLDMEFSSKSTGYACGGTAFGTFYSIIKKTTDAGNTWDSVSANVFAGNFDYMTVVNDTVAYFAGDEFVKTVDGGQTFNLLALTGVTALAFDDPDHGVASSTNIIGGIGRITTISRTTNGGLDWTPTYSDTLSAPASGYNVRDVQAIEFLTSSEAIAGTYNGHFIRTLDSGQTWTRIKLFPDSVHIMDIEFHPGSLTGFLIANKSVPGLNRGYIYKTTDGGTVWNLDFEVPDQWCHEISIINDSVIWFSSEYSIFKTTTGGFVSREPSASDDVKLLVFPNPASEFIRIEMSTGHHDFPVELLNMQGAVCKRGVLTQSGLEWDVSTLPPGIYMVRTGSAGEPASRCQKVAVH